MTKHTLPHFLLAINLFALLSLSACATSGTLVKPEQTAQFAAGHTTYAEVVGKLGQPTTVKTTADGVKTASYTFASVQARPASFIPIVGLVAGGADSTAHTVNFYFDRQDVLKTTDVQDTTIGSNTF